MNNDLKSELKNGDIYTFRVKRNKVRNIKKTSLIQEDCWKLIKDFMIDYTHKRLHYKNDYNYDIEDEDDIIKKKIIFLIMCQYCGIIQIINLKK